MAFAMLLLYYVLVLISFPVHRTPELYSPDPTCSTVWFGGRDEVKVSMWSRPLRTGAGALTAETDPSVTRSGPGPDLPPSALMTR